MRHEKVASEIFKELTLILRDLQNKRLQKLYITDVVATKDLSWATIYYMVKEEQAEVSQELQTATGYLRKQLAQRMSFLRSVPKIKFIFDDTQERAARIDELLAKTTQN